jgi:predicted O-methyltransferase YrrM
MHVLFIDTFMILIPCDDPVAVDQAHVALLFGVACSLKPKRVLELGIGAGYTTEAILQALEYNESGRLTCVDNWIDWNGQEPSIANRLREKGVEIVLSDEETYLLKCESQVYDLLVSDADHRNSHRWVDQHLRVVRDGGFLFFHDTSNSEFTNLAEIVKYVQEKGLWYYEFKESTRSTERCHRGWLMVLKPRSN